MARLQDLCCRPVLGVTPEGLVFDERYTRSKLPLNRLLKCAADLTPTGFISVTDVTVVVVGTLPPPRTGGELREKEGVPRIVEALQSNVWAGMEFLSSNRPSLMAAVATAAVGDSSNDSGAGDGGNIGGTGSVSGSSGGEDGTAAALSSTVGADGGHEVVSVRYFFPYRGTAKQPPSCYYGGEGFSSEIESCSYSCCALYGNVECRFC